MEAFSAAADVRAIGDIIQHPRVRVERRVDEADGAFACDEALLVDLHTCVSVPLAKLRVAGHGTYECEHRSEERRGQTAAVPMIIQAVSICPEISSVGCYIWDTKRIDHKCQ